MEVLNNTVFPIAACVAVASFCAYVVKFFMTLYMKTTEQLSENTKNNLKLCENIIENMKIWQDNSNTAHKYIREEHLKQLELLIDISNKCNCKIIDTEISNNNHKQ